jgi:hypothetical protein
MGTGLFLRRIRELVRRGMAIRGPGRPEVVIGLVFNRDRLIQVLGLLLSLGRKLGRLHRLDLRTQAGGREAVSGRVVDRVSGRIRGRGLMVVVRSRVRCKLS